MRRPLDRTRARAPSRCARSSGAVAPHAPDRPDNARYVSAADGTNNSGREETRARDEAVAKGVTINGLTILSEIPLPTNPLHTNPPGASPPIME